MQLMPFADEETISRLEENLKRLSSVTTMLDKGASPEQMLESVLDGLELIVTDTMPCAFHCNCNKTRVEKALISIGRAELRDMIEEGKEIEVNCHFCNRDYLFSVEELKALYDRAH